MSTVIKAGKAGQLLKRLSTVDLADHLAEARSVVDAAERRASQIMVDAKAQADRVMIEAKDAGYQEGYALGHTEGTEAGRQAAHEEAMRRFEREHGDLVAAMRGAIAAIDTIKEDLRIAAEKDLLDFAVLLARKLTFAIGGLHRESALENLRRALRSVESKTDVSIRMHPDDTKTGETFAKAVLQQADASRVVHIVPDASLAPGGCQVTTDETSVDATLETQVAEIVGLLLGTEAGDG